MRMPFPVLSALCLSCLILFGLQWFSPPVTQATSIAEVQTLSLGEPQVVTAPVTARRPDISSGAPELPLSPADREALRREPIPLPNYVVTTLSPDTNPTVSLGEWKVYSTSNSTIAENYVNAIAVDSTGRPWAGLQPHYVGPGYVGGGVSRYDGGNTWTTFTSPNLVNNWVSAVAADRRDQVWVGSARYYNNGVYVNGGVAVRRTNNAWQQYLINYDVTSIATVGSEVWVGSRPYSSGGPTVGGGVARFDASTDPPTFLGEFTQSNTGGGLANNNVNAIATDYSSNRFCGSAPRYWIGHNQGVSVYVYGLTGFPLRCGYQWFNYSQAGGDPLPNAYITAITIDSMDRVWFGSLYGGGLSALNGSTWMTYTAATSGLTYDNIAALGADRQGRVWIGQTYIIGQQASPSGESPAAPTFPFKITLNVFDNGTWCYYEVGGGTCQNPSPPTGLPSNYVTAIAPAQERIWMGTGNYDGRGVASLTLNWKTFNTSNSPINANTAQAIWLDSTPGRAWIGEPSGVDRFDGSSWRHYPISTTSGLFTDGIVALHRDGAGRLWGAERWDDTFYNEYGVVWLYRPNSDSWRAYQVPGRGGPTSLASDLTSSSRLWVGTNGGGAKVFNIDTSSWVSLTTQTVPIASNVVNAIARDALGQMWLGTDRGLSIYTGSDWMTHTVASTGGGLIGNNVLALAYDGLGRMWVGTSAGVSVISGTTWTTYTVASTGGGLGSNLIDAIAVDPANRIWFSTSNGVSRFDGSNWIWLNAFNSGLASNSPLVRSLAADNADGTWFGTSFGLSVRGVLTGPIGLPAPTLSSFSPVSGIVNTTVTITGTNFHFGGLDGTKVFFAGAFGSLAEATVLSQSGDASLGLLTVRVPFNAVKGKIRVAHSGGVAISSSDFTPVPTVSSYSPTKAAAGIELTVMGANLGGSSKIRFANNVEAPNNVPYAGNQLKIIIPTNAASGALTLITDGGSVALSPSFALASLCPQRTNNTCAPSGDGAAIEVNQGLPSDLFTLVAGKATLVRVYVGTSLAGANAAVDSGTLTISGPSGSTVRFATIPHHTFNNTVRVFSEQYNVNFYLDGSEIPSSGTYSFQVTLRVAGSTVYNASVSRSIERTKDLRFMAVVWGANPLVTETQSLQKAMATVARTYPVRSGVGPLDVNLTRGVRYTLLPGFMAIPNQYYSGGRPHVMCDNIGGFGYVTQVMEDCRTYFNNQRANNGQPDRYDDSVGFVPWRLNPGDSLGCAWGPWTSVVYGNMQGLGSNSSGMIASQEIGHNFGLVRSGEPTWDGGAHSMNENINDPRAFNLTMRQAVGEVHTVMEGSCCSGQESNDNVFFETADYAPLINSIRSFASTGTGQLRPSTHRVFNLFGDISSTGVVHRYDSYLLLAGADITPLSGGPYYLVFLDAANNVLAMDGFPVAFVNSHGGAIDPAPFSVSRPMPDATARVQVRRNFTTLATYTVSTNPPTVSITAPTGGSFGATQAVTITWSASDPDGDALTFSLFYSPDDGATWQVLDAGLTGTSMLWNTALARGTTTGRLKIIASDSFNTAQAISNRFSVAGKPPIVTITSPFTPTRYVEGQLIRFEGVATDFEDGLLPPAALSWSSDRDGLLGNGEFITPTLSVGTHLITLRGTDSNGNIADDTLVVVVESDFDGDGIPDSLEPDNFWNPDDAVGTSTGGVTKLDRSRGVSSPPGGTPGLLVSPSQLYLTAEAGTTTAPAAIQINSTDSSELSWTASKTQLWLNLSATSGTTLATLELTANTSGLSNGTYNDTIRIQAGSFVQTVALTLTVTSRAGNLQTIYLPVVVRN